MADIVIEDGTGILDANSYASDDDLGTYAENNNVTWPVRIPMRLIPV